LEAFHLNLFCNFWIENDGNRIEEETIWIIDDSRSLNFLENRKREKVNEKMLLVVDENCALNETNSTSKIS
jgi:hypothetical protein